MKKKRGKWEHVGVVSVDSGRIWIGDPCYVLDPDPTHRPRAIGADDAGFEAFMESLGNNEAKAFNHDVGREGLGVCIPSSLGDGVFPVQIHRNADGDVTTVVITLIRDED